jgi:putative Mg2+ transporter-C (MgtC) family protein
VDPAGWPVGLTIALQLASALAAGSVIGFERTFNGRAAGFRTFALVALGSCLPMTATSHPGLWLPPGAMTAADIDPTRVMQGIVTGIGFLGAGVIFRDGFSVRGLTTAACVWVVSSIGMLIGMGLPGIAFGATAATLMVLALLRRLESRMPGRVYAYVTVRYRRADAPPEPAFRGLLTEYGLVVEELSFRVNGDAEFEYRAGVAAMRPSRVGALADALRLDAGVTGFRVAPTRD